MFRRIFTSVFIIFVASCASQIMSSYHGKSVQEVMLDYGAPVNAFDMPDGRRVFQWVKGVSYTTPTNITTNSVGTGSGQGNASINNYGDTLNVQHSNQQSAWVSSNTTISGGQTISGTCIYSLFGSWDEARKTWVIVGHQKPRFMCE